MSYLNNKNLLLMFILSLVTVLTFSYAFAFENNFYSIYTNVNGYQDQR